jgi:hypothetical protein
MGGIMSTCELSCATGQLCDSTHACPTGQTCFPPGGGRGICLAGDAGFGFGFDGGFPGFDGGFPGFDGGFPFDAGGGD